MKKNKKKFETKLTKSIVQRSILFSKEKITYLLKLYDKYGGFLPHIFIALFLLCALISIIRITFFKDITSTIAWSTTFVVFVFVTKNYLIILLDSMKYAKSLILANKVVILFFYFIFIPFFLIIPDATKDLNSPAWYIMPTVIFIQIKFLINLCLLIFFYNGFSKKTYFIFLVILLICISLQVSLFFIIKYMFSLVDYIYGFSKIKIIYIDILAFFSNIMCLIALLIKWFGIKYWYEVKIGPNLYRYKKIKGEIVKIFKQGFGNIFLPVSQYARLWNLKDFNKNLYWIKLSNKLKRMHQPDNDEMMINDSFLSNPLFKIYHATLNEQGITTKLIKVKYLVIAVIACSLGSTTIDPIAIYFFLFFGTFFLWVVAFGRLLLILICKNYNYRNFIICLVSITWSIYHLIFDFDIFRWIAIAVLVYFAYCYILHLNVNSKIKKDHQYDFFCARNL